MTNIDYLGVLHYIANSREIPYKSPENTNIPEEKKKMEVIRDNGQNVCSIISAICGLCFGQYALFEASPIKWLDGSGTKTKKCLWAQMKYKEYLTNPVNISLLAEYTPKMGPYFRISLEIKNDSATKEFMESYHKHLDIPNNGLTYVQGSNEWGVPEILNESQSDIKAKVAQGVFKKVRICAFIENIPDATNDYYEEQILLAVEKLIPYYEHVIGYDAYWPSIDEYNPGLTEDDWLRLLADKAVFNDNSLFVMAAFYAVGGEATCAQLADKYGHNPQWYSLLSSKLASGVITASKCPEPPPKDENARYWPVLFVGKAAGKDEHGIYKWKLRTELKNALEQFGILEYLKGEAVVTYDKNMILYGPPGTGKTYQTAIYAVAICDGKKIEDYTDYAAVMKRYNELKAAGRIAFTTFHQSYGYEEFIEGIKPVVDDGTSSLSYSVEPGVFKRFCEKAAMPEKNDIQFTGTVWNVRSRAGDTDVAFDYEQYLYDEGIVVVEDIEDIKRQCNFLSNMSRGDLIVLGRNVKISAVGIVTDDAPTQIDKKPFYWQRKVVWIAKNLTMSFADIGMPGGCVSNFAVAKSKIKVQNLSDIIHQVPDSNPYVFIIDEINRGNISKIFGELITLIEDNKRAGLSEAASVTLPYSGSEFSVPANVYIVGTMNTADRSIALLDTALRRRFRFIELMPNADLLSGVTVDQLNVGDMLRTINERISILYDREHTIGHAFFMKLKDEPTMENLKMIFRKSVVPLLQEYFYEDWGKIQLVLGDNGKQEDKYKFIKDETVTFSGTFKGTVNEIIDINQKYTINDAAFDDINSYLQIM